jgi:2,3-dihydroxybenzoate-AMP ligase
MGFNEVLAAAFARHADANALLTQDGQILSFARLERTVSVFAARLAQEGVSPGQCVAVVTDNNVVRISLFLALCRLGCDTALVSAPAQLAARGQTIDAVVRFPDQDAKGAWRCIDFTQDWLAGSADPAFRMRPAGRLVVGTSGSTGAPRYVRMRPDIYVHLIPHLADGSGPSRGPVMVSIPVTAPFSVFLMIRAFVEGFGFCGMAPTARESLEAAARFGVREMMMTPLALSEVVAAAESGAPIGDLDRIAVFGSVAEGALLARAGKAFRCGVCIINGATEIGQTSFGNFQPDRYTTGWSGKPLGRIEIRIGEGLPQGEVGRLFIRTPAEDRVEGYIGGPPVYDVEGWFDSGDLARLLPDGTLMIEGRADNLINLGGAKYSAERIEELVAQCKGVDICAATRIDPPGGMAPELGIVVVGRPTFNEEEARAFVASRLRTMAKIRIVTCKVLPTLPSGKIDRAALAHLFS